MPTQSQQRTPRLDIPYIMPGQALKYITHNEALRTLDLRVQTRIISRTLAAPPEAAEDGDAYIVPDPAGGWDAPPYSVTCYQDGAFAVYPPVNGWIVWLEDVGAYAHYDGHQWSDLEMSGGIVEQFPRLGVNAGADETNRLTVASPAALFTHMGQDHRLVVNKASDPDTAALLFQNDYTGHAEFGLVGSNDVSLKTSANGQTFNEAFRVNATTSNLRLPDGRQFEFDVDSGNKSGVSYIRIRQGNMSFEKPTSDAALSDGTAFVFMGCGGRNTGNPFWQGLQLTSTIVTREGTNVLPRTSLYWQFSDQDDPDDLTFVIKNTASGFDADIKLEPAGEGAVIADTSQGLRVGPEAVAVEAMLDVQGAIRLKTYTLANLPSNQGAGSIAMVSDLSGGMGMVFYDGTGWRTMHDREAV